MTVSEQDVRNQVAEMRQALQAAAESRRRAGVVKVMGTIAAIIIVVVFVLLFWNLATGVARNPEAIKKAFEKNIQPLHLQNMASKVAMDMMPVVQKETQKLLDDLKNDQEAIDALKAMWEDIKPTIEMKVKAAAHDKVQPALEKEGKQLLAELEEKLKEHLNERFLPLVEAAQDQLAERTDLSEEKLGEIVETLKTACEKAAQAVVKEEMEKAWAVIDKIETHHEAILEMDVSGSELDEENLTGILLKLLGYRLISETPDVAEGDE